MREKVLLIGGFHEMIELCELCQKEIVGIIDPKLNGSYYGYKVIGTDECAPDVLRQMRDVAVVITPDLPKVRARLAQNYSHLGAKFTTLISPRAMISKTACIGRGAVIQSGVNVSAEVKIGQFVKLNTNCTIMHDTAVGDYTTIAPNAVVLGAVTIGAYCYIGSQATILPGNKIGSRATIGAGAVVTKDVREGTTVFGVPAKEKGGP